MQLVIFENWIFHFRTQTIQEPCMTRVECISDKMGFILIVWTNTWLRTITLFWDLILFVDSINYSSSFCNSNEISGKRSLGGRIYWMCSLWVRLPISIQSPCLGLEDSQSLSRVLVWGWKITNLYLESLSGVERLPIFIQSPCLALED